MGDCELSARLLLDVVAVGDRLFWLLADAFCGCPPLPGV